MAVPTLEVNSTISADNLARYDELSRTGRAQSVELGESRTGADLAATFGPVAESLESDEATIVAELLAPLAAFGGFLVQQNRFFGGTTPNAQRFHRDDVFVWTALNAQDLTDPNGMGGLGALTANMDSTAGNCFGR